MLARVANGRAAQYLIQADGLTRMVPPEITIPGPGFLFPNGEKFFSRRSDGQLRRSYSQVTASDAATRRERSTLLRGRSGLHDDRPP
jgi:hypothetical protein